jgi:hypothetical protein
LLSHLHRILVVLGFLLVALIVAGDVHFELLALQLLRVSEVVACLQQRSQSHLQVRVEGAAGGELRVNVKVSSGRLLQSADDSVSLGRRGIALLRALKVGVLLHDVRHHGALGGDRGGHFGAELLDRPQLALKNLVARTASGDCLHEAGRRVILDQLAQSCRCCVSALEQLRQLDQVALQGRGVHRLVSALGSWHQLVELLPGQAQLRAGRLEVVSPQLRDNGFIRVPGLAPQRPEPVDVQLDVAIEIARRHAIPARVAAAEVVVRLLFALERGLNVGDGLVRTVREAVQLLVAMAQRREAARLLHALDLVPQVVRDAASRLVRFERAW